MADRVRRNRSKNRGRKENALGITNLTIRGYKSLMEECSLDIRPLTILAGANSSGKSSAIQPLLLLKQTLEASFDPGAILLNGPNVQFTSAEQLLSKVSSKRRAKDFTIGVRVGDDKQMMETFKKPSGKPFEISEAVYSEPDEEVTRLTPGSSNADLLSAMPEDLRDVFGRISRVEEAEARARVYRERCFLTFEVGFSSADSDFLSPTFNSNPESLFEQHIGRAIHVPGLRGNPERTYKTTAIGSEFPGTFDEYTASVVNHWQATGDDRLYELGSDVETLGLSWGVEARQVDDVQVEIRVGRLPRRSSRHRAGDMVNISDVGFGVSQTLPLLVALLVAEPGQLVYVEQPELHLHPRAQVALARVLTKAARRGVRVVAETHSSLLLLSMQTTVAQGDLLPAEVGLHWFRRRSTDGLTEVVSAELDEAGTFGEWPEDFADVTLDAQSRFLEAVESRQYLQPE